MTTAIRASSDAVFTASSVGQYLSTVAVNPLTDPLWQKLVGQRNSSVFHSPMWMKVLASTYDMDIRAVVVVDEQGSPLAGMPYARISDILGDRIISMPFSDYCDPLAEDTAEWGRLVDELLHARCPVSLRCLHNGVPLSDERFSVAKKARWHGLDLRPNLDALCAGFDDSARRAIRKAQHDGVSVRIAGDEADLQAFFRMHLGIRKRKYRLLAQPYRFFHNIWIHIIQEGKGRLMLAVHDNEVIGGVVFLEWKDTLYYKFNASSPSHLRHRPNDLVIWEGIRYAREKGLGSLDFGLSDWDQADLIRYKRKYASEEKTISFLQYEPNGGPTERERGLRLLLGKLTTLLVDDSVPDSVTDAAGEILYRYFV